MLYLSTRGGMDPTPFGEVLLGGLAPDGGLVLPQTYPRIDDATLTRWRSLGYAQLAFEIVRLYAGDIVEADLRALIDRTYTAEAFGSDDITPVPSPGARALPAAGCPTAPRSRSRTWRCSCSGNLFEYVLAREDRRLNIVGATSGDTGSAAEYAMRGKGHVRVFMLSPHMRMSAFQRAQMYSLADANIFNIAVFGVFDDAQDMVKSVSSDLGFKKRYSIGTVNSINWARVLAQVVYYFKAYFAVTQSNDQQVSFAVPTGNFGNVLAGHVARTMGLPVRKLVVATNENDVLDEFFRTGAYRVRRGAETFETSSPSMDISRASNFERFVHDLLGGDKARVKRLWQELGAHGAFDLAGTPEFARVSEFGFVSGRSTHADRVATIRRVHSGFGVTVDPHTADGMFIAERHREAGVAMVCLETALPVKFSDTIVEALGREPQRPAAFDGIESKAQRFSLMPADVDLLKRYVAQRCEPQQ